VENLGSELRKSDRPVDTPFRPDIEGLRAVAVSLVVLYHAGVPFLTGGFVGVDIFFVISGYLITTLLVNELDSSGGINFPRFYARRARRLLPALTLVVAIVCLTQVVIASPIAQMEVMKAALATILYSSNIYFTHIQLHYFSEALTSGPLLHTWSLAVEEQIYLVWPIVLLLLTRTIRSLRTRTMVIAAITGLSFVGCVWFTERNPVLTFFLSPFRAWEFSIGGVLAFVPPTWLIAHGKLCKWLGTGGVIALLLCGMFVTDSASFPGYVAAIPVLATLAALQAGFVARSSLVVRMLSCRPMQFLGGISYSLYLWHWPILIAVPTIFLNDSAAVRAACVALSVLLAAITHVTIENPVRFNSFLGSRSLLSLGIVGLCTMMCIGGLMIWRVALNHSTQFRKFTQVRNDVPAIYGMGCTADLEDSSPKLCSFGETSNPELSLVLFGDSHAAQWFPALKNITELRHWKLVTIIKSACPPINIKALSNAQAIEACEQWRRLAIVSIQQMRPDIVIMSTSSRYPAQDNSGPIDGAEWQKGSRDTFIAIASRGTAVRVIRDTPHADYDVPLCLAQLEWNGRATCPPLNREAALSADIYQAEVRAAASVANVRVIDMSDAICGADRCETSQGGLVKFRDGDHLTSRYAASLANALQIQLIRSMQ
jgi:peptidoglycan/LPS O-acetylase OafA/YrhL